MFTRCSLFYATAITPLHIGVGRSPGVVDLPVIRDSFGIPFIPGSSLKGALKSLCLRSCIRDRASVECRQCRRVYGWDIRLDDDPTEAYMSPTVFSDAFLVLYPVRVEDDSGARFAYATSLLQLSRLKDILETCSLLHGCENTIGLLETLERVLNRALQQCIPPCSRQAFFNNIPVGNYLEPSELEDLKHELFKQLSSPKAPAIARLLVEGGIYLFLNEEEYREIVEAGMVRQTRVRIDPATKTVETGALWTEEYVPQGAVFAAPVLYRIVESNRAASPDEAQRYTLALLRELQGTVIIGGKETIGKGITKLVNVCREAEG